MERWAQPPTIHGDEGWSHKLRIGNRVWEIPVLQMDEAGIDRLRLGYVCISCLQPHEVPWPEECSLEWCRFPMRRHQAEVFERCFQGWVKLGPQTDLDDEHERLVEQHQRMMRARNPDSKPSIWVPRGI